MDPYAQEAFDSIAFKVRHDFSVMSPYTMMKVHAVTDPSGQAGPGSLVIITELGRRTLLSRFAPGLRELDRDRRRYPR